MGFFKWPPGRRYTELFSSPFTLFEMMCVRLFARNKLLRSQDDQTFSSIDILSSQAVY